MLQTDYPGKLLRLADIPGYRIWLLGVTTVLGC